MKIENFIWLQDIIDKLAFKHHVEAIEVEEVFDNRPKIRFVQKGKSQRGGCLHGLGTKCSWTLSGSDIHN